MKILLKVVPVCDFEFFSAIISHFLFLVSLFNHFKAPKCFISSIKASYSSVAEIGLVVLVEVEEVVLDEVVFDEVVFGVCLCRCNRT